MGLHRLSVLLTVLFGLSLAPTSTLAVVYSTVTLNPPSGPPGQKFIATGVNFLPNVTIYAVETVLRLTTTSDSAGNMTMYFQVDSSSPPRSVRINFFEINMKGSPIASAVFQVTGPPTPVPDTPTPPPNTPAPVPPTSPPPGLQLKPYSPPPPDQQPPAGPVTPFPGPQTPTQPSEDTTPRTPPPTDTLLSPPPSQTTPARCTREQINGHAYTVCQGIAQPGKQTTPYFGLISSGSGAWQWTKNNLLTEDNLLHLACDLAFSAVIIGAGMGFFGIGTLPAIGLAGFVAPLICITLIGLLVS